MEYGILGPLVVARDGVPVVIRAPKQRALLALLLVNANESVSTDRLIDDLWAGEPPAGAMGTLQAYVSNLRRLLEPDRQPGASPSVLVTQPPGYLLRVGPDELDADRAAHLAADGRAALDTGDLAEADRLLGAAEALWRGPVLADVSYEAFAEGDIRRFEELHVAVVEDRVEVALALGRHHEVVGDLQRLVTEHPTRERLRGHLMVALYRAGRQAEALRAYESGRRHLVEELGIDPSPALQQLEAAILQQDPSLAWPGAGEAPVSPPPSTPPLPTPPVESPAAPNDEAELERLLVGRDAELQRLEQHVAAVAAGAGGLILVTGEAGVGKTRLVEEVEPFAAARGMTTVWGRCFDTDDPPPFWPWVQVVRSVVDALPAADVTALATRAGPWLDRLVPELGSAGAPEPTTEADAGTTRARVYDSVATFLLEAARRRPLVIVLEDLHWADVPTAQLLRYLAPQLRTAAALVIASHRPVPSGASGVAPPVADLIRRASDRIELSGLPPAAVELFVAAATGREVSGDLAATLHERSGGNPFFLGEIVRAVEGDDLARAASVVPGGVRDVVRHRLSALGDDVLDVLALASCAVREIPIDVLAAASDTDQGDTLDALDAALTAGVLVEDTEHFGRCRFSHALVKAALHESLSAVRRATLHRRYGQALEARPSADPATHLHDLAHHFCTAAPVGTAALGATYALRAGTESLSVLAHEQAVALFERGIAVALDHRVGDQALLVDLQTGLGTAHRMAGDLAASRRALEQAAATATVAGDGHRLTRVIMELSGAGSWGWARDYRADPVVIGHVEKAIELLGDEDSVDKAFVLGRLAVETYTGGPTEHDESLTVRALETARRLGDDRTVGHVLIARHTTSWEPTNLRDRLAMAKELADIGARTGVADLRVLGHYYLGMDLLELGEVEDADAQFDRLDELTAELGYRAFTLQQGWYRAMRAAIAGRFEEAEGRGEDAAQLTAASSVGNATIGFASFFARLRRYEGRAGEVVDQFRHITQSFPNLGRSWDVELVNLLLSDGQEEEARTRWDDLAADDFAWVPLGFIRSFTLCEIADACSALGDVDRAPLVLDLLDAPVQVAVLRTAHICSGAVDFHRGNVLALLGRPDEAVAAHQRGLALNERLDAEVYAARGRSALAELG